MSIFRIPFTPISQESSSGIYNACCKVLSTHPRIRLIAEETFKIAEIYTLSHPEWYLRSLAVEHVYTLIFSEDTSLSAYHVASCGLLIFAPRLALFTEVAISLYPDLLQCKQQPLAHVRNNRELMIRILEKSAYLGALCTNAPSLIIMTLALQILHTCKTMNELHAKTSGQAYIHQLDENPDARIHLSSYALCMAAYLNLIYSRLTLLSRFTRA